jgi:hypothetical protein
MKFMKALLISLLLSTAFGVMAANAPNPNAATTANSAPEPAMKAAPMPPPVPKPAPQAGPGSAGLLDHYKVYQVEPRPENFGIYTMGQFDENWTFANVVRYTRHLNPVSKNDEGIIDKNAHLSWHDIFEEANTQPKQVFIHNQFGPQVIRVYEAVAILTPTDKVEPGSYLPEELSHYKVYRADGQSDQRFVTLEDQFGFQKTVASEILYFAVPVYKYHNGNIYPPTNPDEHLTFYRIDPEPPDQQRLVIDQFGDREMITRESELLAVPTIKEGWQNL